MKSGRSVFGRQVLAAGQVLPAGHALLVKESTDLFNRE
jgi:hypothetical protein